MAEEQVIETLRLDLKLNKNFDIDDLKKISSRINSISSSIKRLYDAPSLGATRNLLFFIQNLSKSINGIELDKISNLGKSFRALSSISNLAKLEKIDWNKVSSGFKQISIDIDPFLQKVKSAEASLVALNGVFSRASRKKIDGTIDAAGKNDVDLSTLNFAAMLSSLRQVYFWTKRVGSIIHNIAQGGMDYNETLNLWTIAMRGHNEEATKFLNKMNEAYGVSEQTLMNAQATFKNMIGSLGQISSEVAYSLSESITQMALDYASLYNVSIEDAITKFEAALAGQVRPIRSGTGLDITENTLFQFYKELGGEKTIRQLNRTEKQLLAILAVYKQMDASGAIGDMKNTIHYAANQSRVMAETWSDIKDYAGLLVVKFLESEKILVKINARLMFAADIIKALAQSTGAIREQPADSTLSDALGDIAGDASDANEEVEKLKKSLFGFDKFNVLNQTDATEDIDISEEIVDAFKEYEGITKDLKMEARELADEWLEAIGILKDEEGNIDVSTKAFEELKEEINKTAKAAITLASLTAALAIIPKIGTMASNTSKLFSSFKFALEEIATTSKLTTGNVTALGKAFQFLMKHPIVIVIVAIAAALIYLYQNNEEFRESVNKLLDSLKPLLNLLSNLLYDVLTPLSPMLENLTNLLGSDLAGALDGLLPVIKFINLALIPVAYILEFLTKRTASWGMAIDAIINKDWSKFKQMWTTWSANDFAVSSFNDVVSGSQMLQYAEQQIGSQAYVGASQIESSVARGTAIGMSTMNVDTEPTPLNVDVAVDGQRLFQIFRGVAQRNGYDVVEVR